jgi:hypothetical protein
MEATPWLQLGEIGDVRIDVLPTLLMICRVGGGCGWWNDDGTKPIISEEI